ncbi:MAG: GLUG motif-containing protein, partial [Sedimentisphaerales bacterium]
AEDMNQIGQNQDDWDKQFKMTADVNLGAYSGTEFHRIGIREIYPFNGVFDGSKHTIWNFTYTAENSDYIGIFGAVGAAGRIENVSLRDVNITGRNYVGGLTGNNKGNITNCDSTGKAASPNSTQYTGGLTGFNSGDINNCYSTSAVTSGDNSAYIGGLTGENSGNISNCYSMGTVAGGGWSGDIGGLTGYNTGNISNCYATGNVNGGYASSGLGGLVGENDSGIISNCYATGSVNGGDASENLGGLAGANYSGSISSSYFLTSEPNNGCGTPLTDANMKQQSSFVGWDFVWETANGTDDIWAICEDVNYPKLARQFVPGDSDNDKDVDLVDFARLGLKWRQANTNLYCGGMDLTGDGWVNWKDILIMSDHWLEGT